MNADAEDDHLLSGGVAIGNPVVLIIDDSAMIHRLVQAWLTQDSIECVFASDGKSGLEKAVKNRPNLILLDVDMQKQNGLEVCRELKKNPQTANIPVIFLSATSDPRVKIVGLELGAEDYITKPFNPGELRARVKTALRRSAVTPVAGASAK
jgi:two-component system alkaline phosphatase synthesis response regulator PhoP